MYIEVKGSDDAAFQRAVSEFKRRVKKAGIFEDLKKHEYHVKPSLRKKLKRLDALKRKRREENEAIRRAKNPRNDPRGSETGS